MAFEGHRNLEWLYHNAVRQYPFIADASLEAIGGGIIIPNALIVDISIDLPWDRDINAADFFVAQIDSLPEKVQVTIAYQTSSDIIGTFSIDRQGFEDYSPVELKPSSSWNDARGWLTFGKLQGEEPLPVGQFSFTAANARLELQVIRPSANSGLAGLQVISGGVTSEIAHGIVRIRTLANMRARVEQIDDGVYDIWMDAISNVGIDPNCLCDTDPQDPIRTIQQIPADAQGNFQLVGSKCLNFTELQAGIGIENPCSDPCCGCEEAEALTSALIPFGSQLSTVQGQANRLESVIQQMQLILSLTDLTNSCDAAMAFTTTTMPSSTSEEVSTSTGVVSTTSDDGSSTTDLGSTTSDVGSTTSDVGSTTSDVGSTTSDTGSTTSGVASTTSDVASTTSGVASTTSSVVSTTSSVVSTTSGAPAAMAAGDFIVANRNNVGSELSYIRRDAPSVLIDFASLPLPDVAVAISVDPILGYVYAAVRDTSIADGQVNSQVIVYNYSGEVQKTFTGFTNIAGITADSLEGYVYVLANEVLHRIEPIIETNIPVTAPMKFTAIDPVLFDGGVLAATRSNLVRVSPSTGTVYNFDVHQVAYLEHWHLDQLESGADTENVTQIAHSYTRNTSLRPYDIVDANGINLDSRPWQTVKTNEIWLQRKNGRTDVVPFMFGRGEESARPHTTAFLETDPVTGSERYRQFTECRFAFNNVNQPDEVTGNQVLVNGIIGGSYGPNTVGALRPSGLHRFVSTLEVRPTPFIENFKLDSVIAIPFINDNLTRTNRARGISPHLEENIQTTDFYLRRKVAYGRAAQAFSTTIPLTGQSLFAPAADYQPSWLGFNESIAEPDLVPAHLTFMEPYLGASSLVPSGDINTRTYIAYDNPRGHDKGVKYSAANGQVGSPALESTPSIQYIRLGDENKTSAQSTAYLPLPPLPGALGYSVGMEVDDVAPFNADGAGDANHFGLMLRHDGPDFSEDGIPRSISRRPSMFTASGLGLNVVINDEFEVLPARRCADVANPYHTFFEFYFKLLTGVTPPFPVYPEPSEVSRKFYLTYLGAMASRLISLSDLPNAMTFDFTRDAVVNNPSEFPPTLQYTAGQTALHLQALNSFVMEVTHSDYVTQEEFDDEIPLGGTQSCARYFTMRYVGELITEFGLDPPQDVVVNVHGPFTTYQPRVADILLGFELDYAEFQFPEVEDFNEPSTQGGTMPVKRFNYPLTRIASVVPVSVNGIPRLANEVRFLYEHHLRDAFVDPADSAAGVRSRYGFAPGTFVTPLKGLSPLLVDSNVPVESPLGVNTFPHETIDRIVFRAPALEENEIPPDEFIVCGGIAELGLSPEPLSNRTAVFTGYNTNVYRFPWRGSTEKPLRYELSCGFKSWSSSYVGLVGLAGIDDDYLAVEMTTTKTLVGSDYQYAAICRLVRYTHTRPGNSTPFINRTVMSTMPPSPITEWGPDEHTEVGGSVNIPIYYRLWLERLDNGNVEFGYGSLTRPVEFVRTLSVGLFPFLTPHRAFDMSHDYGVTWSSGTRAFISEMFVRQATNGAKRSHELGNCAQVI